MAHVGALDWVLAGGVFLLGWFLAVYLENKYKLLKKEFFVVSCFVAGLSAILIGAYHTLRELLIVFP